jgi:uncharacterized protein (TIGR00255 family)
LSLSSMTGFTRVAGQHDDVSWVWEIRSVNGKGLDVRVRLPNGYEALEAVVRDIAGKVLNRGSVSISLAVSRTTAASAYRVNRDLLENLLALSAEVRDDKRLSNEPVRLDTLLTVRGVVEVAEEEDDPREAEERQKAMATSLHEGLEALTGVRRAEGSRLETILRERLEELDRLCSDAEGAAAMRTEAIRERLAQQVKDLVGMSPALPEERLAQEAAVLAVKADVREELDRLKSHIEGARALLEEAVAIGRKLDFLCQEFNREANTLCSKSGDIELTRIGLAMKATIDQFREQALNVE